MSEPIGNLRHKITLQRLAGPAPGSSPSNDKDDSGGLVPSVGTSPIWENLTTVGDGTTMARVSPLSGREAFLRGRLQGEQAYEVVIRSRSPGNELTQADRILFEGKTLQIKWIADKDERRINTKLLCQEGPPS